MGARSCTVILAVFVRTPDHLASCFEDDLYGITNIFVDDFANPGFDWEHVVAITHGHETAFEGLPVDMTTDFDGAAGL